MSLNKLTDLSHKDWMNVGCNVVEAKRVSSTLVQGDTVECKALNALTVACENISSTNSSFGDVKAGTGNVTDLAVESLVYSGGIPSVQLIEYGTYDPRLYDENDNEVSYSFRYGTWNRIGKTIFVSISIDWSSKDSASAEVRISLPFTSGSHIPNVCFTIGRSVNIQILDMLTAINVAGTNYIIMNALQTFDNYKSVNFSDFFRDSGVIQLSGFYDID